jgi:hypothetical protein
MPQRTARRFPASRLFNRFACFRGRIAFLSSCVKEGLAAVSFIGEQGVFRMRVRRIPDLHDSSAAKVALDRHKPVYPSAQ